MHQLSDNTSRVSISHLSTEIFNLFGGIKIFCSFKKVTLQFVIKLDTHMLKWLKGAFKKFNVAQKTKLVIICPRPSILPSSGNHPKHSHSPFPFETNFVFLGKIVLFERSLTSSSILFKTIFWITTSHELISIFEPCWFLLFIDRKAGEIIRLIAPSVRVCETYLCQLVWWNHDMSPKVTMLNWRIFGYLWWFNMVTFDDIFQFNMVTSYDIWWYLVAFDDNWRFCVTKPHRLSWYVMTYHTLSWYLTNQFREVRIIGNWWRQGPYL